MAMYPHVQEKAQRELDRVIGSDRLPMYEDSESLPYIQAVIRESLGWIPNIPMGVPHRLLVEDEYMGSMSHNVVDYPNPDVFNPERFLTADGQIDPKIRDPDTHVFGFGRSSVLSAFNIRPACDENGSPVELHLSDIMPEDGLFLYEPPILFVCEADH
ncbi:hypothetical protein EIP86_002190 [Pleurotus ostreatoroseus]|nr:hypothetical protein EIP86_002190 [Pleurotus ostreatoroseus]